MEKRTKVIVAFSILTISVATFVMIFYHTSSEEATRKAVVDVTGVTFHNFGTNLNTTCSDELIILLGDGYCDDEANTEACSFDRGDCCLYDHSSAFTLCSDCHCIVNISETASNLDCLQLQHSVANKFGSYTIGNGKCDQVFNNIDYFFDAGDCCMNENAENCIVSNFYCEEDTLGDGICQDYNNGPLCSYDFGDCCDGNWDECCLCQCLPSSNFIDPYMVGGAFDHPAEPWLG